LNKALIDTDIFSEITKASNRTVIGHATVYRKAFLRYTISAVTIMEVIRGHQKKQALRQLQHFPGSHRFRRSNSIRPELRRVGWPHRR
jgi:tRNA(fMet)-specific endonuclease VapC